MSDGCVYLVGAGPGDPGLLTLRGREVLSQADVVVYDHLAPVSLLNHAPPEAERIYVGKQASAHTLSQEDIESLLVRLGREGKCVVRLKGGDPFVFGRGGEEALALVEANVAFEVVPGITAGIAAAAYAGIPVTHRELASNFGMVTGHEAPDKEGSDLDFHALADWKGTLAFYMGVKNLEAICASLMANGLDGQTPVAVIHWGTTSRQRVVTGVVQDIAAATKQADIKPPALVVVGKVVSLREKLNWFERRPLFGRRIVVTRARRQASQLATRLAQLGADVIELPTIRIEPPEDLSPLDEAARNLASFDWIVLTSVNGVDAFFAALDRVGLDSRALATNKICVIGPATAERLAQFGIRPDAQPARFVSAAIIETLAAIEDLKGRRVLCPRADVAPNDLIEDLTARGAIATEIVAYRTLPEDHDSERAAELFASGEIHWITFTSSSTVKNFFSLVRPEQLASCQARLASIGPVTSQTIREFGLQPSVEAKSHTISGLIDAILEAKRPGGKKR